MEFDIINHIIEILYANQFTNFYEGWYRDDIKDTHITFICLKDTEDDFSEDENTSETYLCQFDIWSESSEESLIIKNKLKKTLKANDFSYIDGQDAYEKDTKIHHKAIRVELNREM